MSGRDDERVGERLGDRYVVVAHVADGGMGSVYEARDELMARRVMVKVMHRDLVRDPTLMERFRREALAAASLGHPHIVQTTDFALELGKQAFLVMEYLKGQTLGDALVAHGALSADRVVFIASQVLDALSSAHEAGIVHRDLKPSNIFLTQLSGVRDVVKLLDFGIAKLWESPEMQRLTRAGQVVGTPGFMAPEQLRGDDVDGRTDLYALGLVMYGALSGRPPFPTHAGLDQAAHVLAHEPRPLAELCPELDPGLVQVVSRAMSKDPGSRFADADQMRRALGPWLDSSVRALHPTPPQPMAARPSGVPAPSAAIPTRPRPRRRVSRGLIIAFVALVVVLAAGAALATVVALTYATGAEEPPAAVTPPPPPAAPAPTPTVGAPPTPPPLPTPPGAMPEPDQGEAPAADDPSPSPDRPGRGSRPSGGGQPADEITRGPCAPQLQVDTVAAFGLFAQADVGALVRAREPRLLACAARTPTGTHRVELETQVDAQGGTVSPRVTSPGDLGPTDLACVRQAFAGLELPETENEMAGILRLGLTLKGCGQAGP